MTDAEIKQWMLEQGRPKAKPRVQDRPGRPRIHPARPARVKPGSNSTLDAQARTLEKMNRLLASRVAGQTFSQSEIARHCGLSVSAICKIERRALRTIRERLRKSLGLTVPEMLEISHESC